MKRVWTLVIVALMMLSLLAGCSTQTNEPVQESQSATQETETAVAEASETAVAEETAQPAATDNELSVTEAVEKAKDIAELISSNQPTNIEGDPTIAIVMPTLDNQGWIAIYTGALKKLIEMGAGVETYSANDDVEAQVRIINDCIAKGVDGIIFAPLDAAACSAAVESANEAGVPIVAMDSGVSGGQLNGLVETDNYGCGVEAAKSMATVADGEELTILNMQGDMAFTSGIDRSGGFEDTAVNYDNFNIVSRIAADWKAEKANAAILDAFQAHPDINAMYLATDGYTQSVMVALEQLGKLKPLDDPDHIIVIANDGFPVGLDYIRQGYVDANSSQQLFVVGGTAADVCMKAIADPSTEPADIKVPTLVITKDNVDDETLWGNQF